MKEINAGATQAAGICPKVSGLSNAASRAPLTERLVADCVIAISGENFSLEADEFETPVNDAFGAFVSLSTGDRFPIYAISPDEIVCVVPGTLARSQHYALEMHIPQPGPIPCPTIVLKGGLRASAPGLFTKDGTGQGRGLFFTYPDGEEQPIRRGGDAQAAMVQVYATGLRHARELPAAFIDGRGVTVVACEADTARPGYDRLIFQLPGRGLESGTHRFKVIADGESSNEVEIELL